MRVRREDLLKTSIKRLVVVDPGETDQPVGGVVGYWCPDCAQADESLEQIWHDEGCDLAGEHGRSHYSSIEPDVPGRPSPELSQDHPIALVEAADTGPTVKQGGVLAFRCDGCGNLDEDCFEVVHDSPCALSTDHDEVLVEIDCPETTEIAPE